jgi:hypothetical protein
VEWELTLIDDPFCDTKKRKLDTQPQLDGLEASDAVDHDVLLLDDSEQAIVHAAQSWSELTDPYQRPALTRDCNLIHLKSKTEQPPENLPLSTTALNRTFRLENAVISVSASRNNPTVFLVGGVRDRPIHFRKKEGHWYCPLNQLLYDASRLSLQVFL